MTTPLAADAFAYDVFLAHNSADKPEVELLARRLATEAGFRVFFDARSLVPGEPSTPAIERALEQSQTIAVLVGAAGLGPWQNQEYQAAIARAVQTKDDVRVIPVLLPGADRTKVHGFLANRTWVEFQAGLDDPTAFSRLLAGIKGVPTEIGEFELSDDLAPYRGLERFETEQADLFFGRDADVAALLEKVRASSFVAVIGASGCGKSSLVRAGLLHRLKLDALPGSRQWRTITFEPGGNPWRALADQLAGAAAPSARLDEVDRIAGRLAQSSSGLREVLTTLQAEHPAPLLLVIDQFEELFTHDGGPSSAARQDREKFVDALFDVSQCASGRIRVVITLRADFLDHALKLPKLRELLQDRHFLLGELGPEALREAIVGPARKVGAFLENGLVPLILKDVAGQSGILPLFQHALDELWRDRRGPWLTLASYQKSGGVNGALQQRAQATYDGLAGDEQRKIARNLLTRLTTLGEGVADTRCRVLREELYSRTCRESDVDEVIQKLSGKTARLIRLDRTYVEITHEALIQHWPLLREWLEADRKIIRVHRRLTQAANEWKEKAESDGDLYPSGSARFAELNEFARPLAERINDLEKRFSDASINLSERQRKERESRNRLVRWGAIAIVTVLCGLLFAAATQYFKAKRNAQIAEAETHRARAGQYAAFARAAENEDPVSALLFATEAVLATDRVKEPWVPVATTAFYSAFEHIEGASDFPGNTSNSGSDNNDNEMIENESSNGNAFPGDLAGSNDFPVIWKVHVPTGVGSSVINPVLSHDMKWAAAVGDNGAGLYDLSKADAPLVDLIPNDGHYIPSISLSPQGRWLAIHGNRDGKVYIYDLHSPDVVASRKAVANPGDRTDTLAWDEHDRMLLALNETGAGWVMKLMTETEPDSCQYPLPTTAAGYRSPTISSNGRLVFVPGNQDHLSTLIKLNSGCENATPRMISFGEHFYTYGYAEFSGDGRYLALITDEIDWEKEASSRLELWDVSGAGEPKLIFRRAQADFKPRFSPDSKWLVASMEGRSVKNDPTRPTLQAWKLADIPASQEPIRVREHTGWVTEIAFSKDGRWLFSAGNDSDNGYLWDLSLSQPFEKPMPLRAHRHAGDHVWQVEFSADGNWLATATNGPDVRVWRLPTNGEGLVESILPAENPFGTLTFSPDSRWLAAYTSETGIGLWAMTAVTLSTSPIELDVKYRIDKMGIDESNSIVYAIQSSGITFWSLPRSELLKTAARVAGRNLSWPQWRKLDQGLIYRKTFPELPPDPSIFSGMLEAAEKAGAASGEVKELYSALTRFAEEVRDPSQLNHVCWSGSLESFPSIVLPACEAAVKLRPQSGKVRDSRGVARALLGDLDGAKADFEFYVEKADPTRDSEAVELRKGWIAELKNKRNPIDKNVLEKLKD